MLELAASAQEDALKPRLKTLFLKGFAQSSRMLCQARRKCATFGHDLEKCAQAWSYASTVGASTSWRRTNSLISSLLGLFDKCLVRSLVKETVKRNCELRIW